jgi:NADPH:quinone reductase-like Zn-dependent oxidoreductase
MKAAQYNAYGGPNVLAVRDVPAQSLGHKQLLVRVHAASINPFDLKIMSGMYKDMMPLTFPITPGGDFAGVVTAVGEKAAGFAVGDEVYGSANRVNGGSGSFAEHAIANAASTARKPRNTTFTEAAALPLVGASAVQALEEHIKLRPGQKILIHGGAGGIGHIAVQLAKTIGAYVATTVGSRDVGFVKTLGAVEVIDYRTQTFETMRTDFDAVFDMVGGEVTTKSFAVLKKGGTLVSMVGQPDNALAKEHGVVAIGQGTKTNTRQLQRLTELVESGKIKVHVDKTFPLDNVRAAFQLKEDGHPRGKVVLKITY